MALIYLQGRYREHHVPGWINAWNLQQTRMSHENSINYWYYLMQHVCSQSHGMSGHRGCNFLVYTIFIYVDRGSLISLLTSIGLRFLSWSAFGRNTILLSTRFNFSLGKKIKSQCKGLFFFFLTGIYYCFKHNKEVIWLQLVDINEMFKINLRESHC